MKQFSPFATKIVISFVCEYSNELVEWEINEIPVADFTQDFIRDSENSTEIEFSPSDEETYRAVLYVNSAEGNIELFNDKTGEEITDFEIHEYFNEEDDLN